MCGLRMTPAAEPIPPCVKLRPRILERQGIQRKTFHS